MINRIRTSLALSAAAVTFGVGFCSPFAFADQVIPDDLIVQGSICVGLDCVNNESFGFDTIRLKENNTRIKFEDTSVGTFPSTDWQLTANDSASGGQNRFSIEDITAARNPFTIEGGAATNSIYVDNTGRVGFRTSTPVLDLHVNTSNTPAMRLEQNSSGGFSAQTWDIAGNEANFFVRDVTAGSRLVFRIRPGAPTSSIDIASNGKVGMGTASPAANLDVVDTAGSGPETMLRLANNGNPQVILENTNVGNIWEIGGGNNLVIEEQSSGNGVIFTLADTGALTIGGALTQNSDKTRKMAIEAVEPSEILEKVAALDVSSWTYIHDAETGIRHIGPMAQDFYALFGTGADGKGISSLDTSGVALASIKALRNETMALNERIEAQKAEIEWLKSALKSGRYR